MSMGWERDLDRWLAAGLIDAASGARIRAFEAQRQGGQGLGLPVVLAIGLGALLLGAGVLLFVAAHWDALSPAMRFSLVLSMVAAFHIGGIIATHRFPALATALHALGTVSLGAGIHLSGQIFHLQEHWPAGVMLWAIGAWFAWALLRDVPQAMLVAILTPAWLAGEWAERAADVPGAAAILTGGLLLLGIVYLTATGPGPASPTRRALTWIGTLGLLPLCVLGAVARNHGLPSDPTSSTLIRVIGWLAALGLPLALAWLLRGRAAWPVLVAAVWVLLLTNLEHIAGPGWRHWGHYLVWAIGAIGLIAWGLLDRRPARINLGVAGFALTVLAFYFSAVGHMLGRSASLVGLGILFVVGGGLLERARRRLVARSQGAQQ